MYSRTSKPVIFGGHISTAAMVGLAGGLVYFALEVLMGYRGQYTSLGQPLPRVLAVYLIVIVGGLMGLALPLGVLSAAGGRAFSLPARTRLYVAATVFGLSLLWLVRNWSVARFKGILFGGDAWVVPVLAVSAIAVGFVAGWVANRFASGTPHRRGIIAVPAVGVLIVLLFLSSRGMDDIPRGDATTGDAPNVVMILLDALRADHLSCYGYDRETSPRLDALAAEGVTFLNARSHGNRTILAMPALFTSTYPSFNGAMGMGALMRPLGEDETTVAEMLDDRGYTTLGLMTNIHVKSVFGMTQGFDKVEEFNGGRFDLSIYRVLHSAGIVERPAYATDGRPTAGETTDLAIKWLDQVGSRERFFLYVHYMDTHHPYRPPEEYADMFGGITTDPKELFIRSKSVIRGDYDAFGDGDLQTLRNYYDACIRYNDHEIGRIIDRVRKLSTDRQTIFIVTADHGDEFLEHGTLYHNNLLIESLTRVPLIIAGLDGFERGLRVESLVRHIDIMPTLAEVAGAELPAKAKGQSLVPLLTGATSDLGLSAFAEGDHCYSYVSGNWKVTYVDTTNEASLYNVHEDPMERRDLSDVETERMEAMLGILLDYREETKRQRRQQMEATTDEETLRQLRALGYIN